MGFLNAPSTEDITTEVVSTIWRIPNVPPGFLPILVTTDRTEITSRTFKDYVRSGPAKFDESNLQTVTLVWAKGGAGGWVQGSVNSPPYLTVGFGPTSYFVKIGEPVLIPAELVTELRVRQEVTVQ